MRSAAHPVHGLLRPALALVLAGASVSAAGCKRGEATQAPEAGSAAASSAAMGTWDAWRDLSPLIEVAQTHAPKATVAGLETAAKLLRKGQIRAADRALAELSDSEGRHWIATARGDLGAFYFTTCIRGLAWRLPESATSGGAREVDFDEGTPIESSDLAIEPLLVGLDAAVDAQIPALTTQARIARARVTAYVARCAPNRDVAEMGEAVFKGDLALLAAEGHLTPDLAYLWGGVQLSAFSGAAAKPFLLQAREAGFDDPALPYLLAVIALEQRDLDKAEAYADEALAAMKKVGDTSQEAQAHFIRGEIARARKTPKDARAAYDRALDVDPDHVPALLGLVNLDLEGDGELAAAATLAARLPILKAKTPLAAEAAEDAAARLENLVIMISEPALASVIRTALLEGIDDDPDALRRGLRYYFIATLDIRLSEVQSAKGHALLARDEFMESEVEPPVDVEELLVNLAGVE
ncbi:MAG: tetratricopeptide repeat protein [Nannocystaceae bacterium]